MTVYQVDVNPAVLVWAREAIGLSRKDAAHALDMTELSLRYLEEGVGDVPVIGAVGNVRRQKAYDVLVDAAVLLRDDHPGLRVLIAGGGEDEPRVSAHIADRGGGSIISTASVAAIRSIDCVSVTITGGTRSAASPRRRSGR